MKAKNPKVGEITCRHHDDVEVLAGVFKSLKTAKLYINCPECGLIMPTLPAFQQYIKKHAKFNMDIAALYKPANDDSYESKSIEPANDAKYEQKKRANSFEDEMGL